LRAQKVVQKFVGEVGVFAFAQDGAVIRIESEAFSGVSEAEFGGVLHGLRGDLAPHLGD